MDTRPATDNYPAFIRFLSRHLLVLGVNYVALDKDGKETGEEQFLACTCTVFSHRDRWFLLTAGHVVEDLEELVSTHQIKILRQELADYFGPDAGPPQTYPFDFFAAPKVWKFERGLDFAMVPLDSMYRQMMEMNAVVPWREFTMKPEPQPFAHRMLGCPGMLTSQNRMASDQPLVGFVRPVSLLLTQLPDDTREEYPRFSAQIEDTGLADIKGMSGGPIFAFGKRPDHQTIYWFVGLQSKWNKTSRVVFSCPLKVGLD